MTITDGEEKLLIRDALQDFIRMRSPAGQYVWSRYPRQDAQWKARKIIQVEARIRLAKQLMEREN